MAWTVLALLATLVAMSDSSPLLRNAIDLTHPVGPGITMQWPSTPAFIYSVDFKGVPEGKSFFYTSASFNQSEHSGTHLDAPAHFAKGDEIWGTAEIPFSRLAGPGVKIDVAKKAKEDWDYQVTVDDIKEWEAEHGRIPELAVVIMYSDWGKHYMNKTRYFGYPAGVVEANPKDTANLHFPAYHVSATKFLVEERNVIGLAVDTPSTDYGQSPDFMGHQVMAKNNVWGLENLADVDQLPAKGFTMYAMPHKLKGGSGGPCRAFAVLDSSARSEGKAESLVGSEGGATSTAGSLALLVVAVLTIMIM